MAIRDLVILAVRVELARFIRILVLRSLIQAAAAAAGTPWLEEQAEQEEEAMEEQGTLTVLRGLRIRAAEVAARQAGRFLADTAAPAT